MHIDRTRTDCAKVRTATRRTARRAKMASKLFPCTEFPPFIARALSVPAQIGA